MANQVPFFTARPLARGRTGYGWTPSPKWRKLGFTFIDLGEDRGEALKEAERLNQMLANHGTDKGFTPGPAPRPAQNLTFGELVTAYLASREFSHNERGSPKSKDTQKQYKWALGRLELWAEEGRTIARLIDPDMVETLKDQLIQSSIFTAASMLRALNIVMEWAVKKKHLPANPCAKISFPTPPARTKRILESTAMWLINWLEPQAPELALATAFGFFSAQRQADIMKLTTFNWRALDDMAGEDRRALNGTDGRVMGISLIQGKTKEPISVPLTIIRDQVERERARRLGNGCTDTWLVGYTGKNRDADQAMLKKDFREWRNRALDAARASGSNQLVDELTGLTFRDLRRSGMCWLRDLGCTIPMIAAISGHSIAYTTKILDTYMPKDSRIAAAGMAHAITRHRERVALDQAAEQAIGDLTPYREEARRRWGRASPLRIGTLVGEAGIEIAAPSSYSARGQQSYLAGLEDAKLKAEGGEG